MSWLYREARPGIPLGFELSAYLTPVDLRLVGPDTWLLLAPLRYHSDLLRNVVHVPAGFRTDLASVPRLPLAYLMAGGHAPASAIVHDWLIETDTEWVLAAQVFREAMAVEGVALWRRTLMYSAVRLRGWRK